MKIRSALGIVLLSLVSGAAFAGVSVPEPGILELLSIGAVAAVVVALRKRRK
jgi:PEP-CTERM motif-containing protein